MSDLRNQVVWNRLISIVEEQALTLVRIAFSTSVREAGDLSAGIYDTEGRMIAQAVTGTPGHVNTMAAAVVNFIEDIGPHRIYEGDSYITNDPWKGTGHLHDFTVVTPTFRAGRLIGFFACTAHVLDVGGNGYGPDSRDVHEEGLLVPIMKFAERGDVNRDLVNIVRHNVREADQVVGDLHSLAACNDTGRRRLDAMLDEFGENIVEAPPSRPALVLGLTAVPGAGDNFMVVDDDRIARQIAEKREARERAAMQAKRRVRRSLEDFMASMEKGESQELNLILKGDVSGSVEALEDALSKIDVGDEVGIRVIDRGVGAITETNVDLAAASDAIIIGFNVRPQGKATEMADREGVEIRYYSVIYQAIEEIEAALKGMLKPEYEEVSLGKAEIRAIFRSSKIGNIAGCMVTEGLIRRNAKVRLVRDGAVVADNLDLASLKRERDDASEVREGFECGLVLRNFQDIKEGDFVEAFEMREIPRG